MEQETIFGQVVAKANSYQAVPDSFGGKRIIKNQQIRRYEQLFSSQCKLYKGMGINAKFRLKIIVYQSSMRFDLDNSLKTVLDCLQMVGAITDDNLCYEIQAAKEIDKKRPRIIFSLEEIEPKLFDTYKSSNI